MLDLITISVNTDFPLAWIVNSSDKVGKALNQVFSDVFTDTHHKC